MCPRFRSRSTALANRRERGFSFMTVALAATVLIGMLGLALDLGRMYIVKNELQAFTDSSSIAAVYELDGTMEGIERARTKSQTGPGTTPNRWNFYTSGLTTSQISTAFSTISTGGWETNPASATGIGFARVGAYADVPVYMMRILGVSDEQRVQSISYAGMARTSIRDHGDPFSPDAINPADPNYGFIPDDPSDGVPPLRYALKWVPQGLRCDMYPPNPNTVAVNQMCAVATTHQEAIDMAPSKGYCSGDYFSRYQPNVNGYAATPAEADRGYINIGQGTGTNALAESIINRNYQPAPANLAVGDSIAVVSGNRPTQMRDAMNIRVATDSNTTATSYYQYDQAGDGNGRRLVRVPVNDPRTNIIIGYATFFLPSTPCGTGNNDPCCAEFVSNQVFIGGAVPPITPNGGYVYSVKLFSGGQ